MKKQDIFYNYEDFLRDRDLSDRVVMIMTYDFDLKGLNSLMTKLKSSNARIHSYKIENGSQTIDNIFSIIKFMEKNMVDTLIGIGEDFIADLIKGITIFYSNKTIDNLHKLEQNKMFLKYGNLKESIFISTTGGGSEYHKYFKLIDMDSLQVTIFGDDMCKIDTIILDPEFSKESPIEYIIYYLFSSTCNLVDVMFNDNIDRDSLNDCKEILKDIFLLFDNGDKFGESTMFREKVLLCSLKSSMLLDKFGYGILYLYGNLLEGVFSIPRHNIDVLGIEFLSGEMEKKYALTKGYPYFHIDYNDFSKYKIKYNLDENLKSYDLDLDMINKVKKVSYEFLFSHKIINNYRVLNFDEDMNRRLFEYYLNGNSN